MKLALNKYKLYTFDEINSIGVHFKYHHHHHQQCINRSESTEYVRALSHDQPAPTTTPLLPSSTQLCEIHFPKTYYPNNTNNFHSLLLKFKYTAF